MAKLLISSYISDGELTNGLYLLDTESKKYIDVITGRDFMGVVSVGDTFWIAERSKGLCVLDKNLNIIHEYPLECKNLHDIVYLNKRIYVVDSYKDRIILVDPRDGVHIGTLYPFEQSNLDDNHHFNSLRYNNDGSFYLSMFSYCGFDKYEKQITKNVADGCIVKINIDTGKVEGIIVSGLHHPHSIQFIEDKVMYAESRGYKVCENTSTNPWSEIYCEKDRSRYLRGICNVGNNLYIGESAYREDQKFGELDKNASVLVVNKLDGYIDSIELPTKQIYDIVLYN